MFPFYPVSSAPGEYRDAGSRAVAAEDPAAEKLEEHQRTVGAAGPPLNGKALGRRRQEVIMGKFIGVRLKGLWPHRPNDVRADGMRAVVVGGTGTPGHVIAR